MGVNSQASIYISFRFSLSNTPLSQEENQFSKVSEGLSSSWRSSSVELINLTSEAVKS